MESMRGRRFSELPSPISLAADPVIAYVVQVFIIPKPAGGHRLLKHVIFNDKVKVGHARPWLRGAGYAFEWEGNARNFKKAVQHMFNHMGGFRSRWSDTGAESVTDDQELLDKSGRARPPHQHVTANLEESLVGPRLRHGRGARPRAEPRAALRPRIQREKPARRQRPRGLLALQRLLADAPREHHQT